MEVDLQDEADFFAEKDQGESEEMCPSELFRTLLMIPQTVSCFWLLAANEAWNLESMFWFVSNVRGDKQQPETLRCSDGGS